MTGLPTGVSYTFTVVATNAVGDSAASSASNSVRFTPVAIPALPGWGLLLLASLLAAFGLPRLRQRQGL